MGKANKPRKAISVKYFYITAIACFLTGMFVANQSLNTDIHIVEKAQTKEITEETIEIPNEKAEGTSAAIQITTEEKTEDPMEAIPEEKKTVTPEIAPVTQEPKPEETLAKEEMFIEWKDKGEFPEESNTAKLVKVATPTESGLLLFGTEQRILVAMNAPIGQTFEVETEEGETYGIIVAAEESTTGFFAIIVDQEKLPEETRKSGNAALLREDLIGQIKRIK